MESSPQLAKEVPFLKGLPLVGNLFNIESKYLHLKLHEWCDQYDGRFNYKVGPMIIHVFSDLDTIYDILKRRPHDFRRVVKIESVFKEIGTHGVFSVEGEAWRRQRRLIMPAFHQGHLKGFFGTLCTITGRLKSRLEAEAKAGSDFEISKDLMRFTVDVTTKLAFDYDMNTLEKGDDIIQKHLEHIFPSVGRRVTSIFPYWKFVKLPRDRALDRALVGARREITKIIEANREASWQGIDPAPDGTTRKPKNMIQTLLTSRDADGTGFTMDEILGNVFTIMIAGEDTTATSLAWALTFMIEHPEVKERMKKEAHQVLGESEIPAQFEQLDGLKYIEAVILESMRLKPVAPCLFFEANHDLTLGGERFSKGTIVNAMISRPARQEKYFSHANEFRPERWIEKERDPSWKHEAKALLPFGGGARMCPGKTLAMVEMKCVLAMLCRNFEVQKPKNEIRWKEEFRFSAVPIDFWVRIETLQ